MLDPLATANRIRREYRGYLRSTFALQDPHLDADFEKALDGSFPLARGPYLQASPQYEPGRSIADLVEAGVLVPRLAELGDALPADRPLYAHQEEAVRKARAGRNLVVATGTGSGKTESFMLPILDHLLREAATGTLAEPGVRALLLYPMNALANDQQKRLRSLLVGMPEITFGRYVGETQEGRSAALEQFRSRNLGADPPPNELLSRREMRDTPPHILLTNFAMLEYLLLRPDDSPFFDGPSGGSWRFLVLDEVHVYDGAQGTEIAMLLRRVRDRVVRSERRRLQCFATSATLGRGVDDYPALVEFAQNLFGEPFEWVPDDERRQDVVGARRLPLRQGRARHRLSNETLRSLHRAYRDGGEASSLAEILSRGGVDLGGSPDDAVPAVLLRGLRDDERVQSLQERLEKGACATRELSAELFPDADDADARLVELIDLCVAARAHDEDAPLIPARYHFFVRSLDGAYACLHPAHDASVPRVLLTRHEHCPTCTDAGRRSRLIELGACSLCGAEYAVGKLSGKHLELAGPGPIPVQLLLYEGAREVEEDDEDEVNVWGGNAAQTAEAAFLCVSCGQVDTTGGCMCEGKRSARRVTVVRTIANQGDDERPVRRCPACGGRSTGEVVRRFETGADAPVAVIATDLYQQLPPATAHRALDHPGQGRKLLVFSDSRQDAAFFASYLERTYMRSLVRRLIVEAIEDAGRPEVWMVDLEPTLAERAAEERVIDPDASPARQLQQVRTWLMQEIVGTDVRLSLHGTGVAETSFVTPRGLQAPPALIDLGFDEAEAIDFVMLLLDTLRRQGAVAPPDHVDLREEAFAPRNMPIFARQAEAGRHVVSWLPVRGSNSRLDFVQKVMRRLGRDADAREILAGVWRWLTCDEWRKVLAAEPHKTGGVVHRLSYGRMAFRPASESHPGFACDTCRRVTWRSLRTACPHYRCDGSLVPLGSGGHPRARHYVGRYRSLSPIGLTVEEHTAQWTATAAGEIQERFVRGEVNVLSCSTTFELGVDVGEVQAVLLRNVPPSPANYVQRAGRAGRRTDSAALVVTFAQRRNHDAHYFAHPEAMIEGVITPPVIVLDNLPIARRHAHSVAFAAFERRGESHGTVGDFFGDGNSPAPSAALVEWLNSHPVEVGEALARLLPDPLPERLGIAEWRWVTELAEESSADPAHGWLARAEAEVQGDLKRIEEEIAQLVSDRQFARAGHFQRLRTTLEGRPLIGFLGSRNILPKYGFPVDVVELDVSLGGDADSTRIELTRDLQLAVAEFAPGSTIVAAKKLWEPQGLRTRSDRVWPEYHWATCKDCGTFRSRLGVPTPECDCGSTAIAFEGSFLTPIWGFIGGLSPRSPGESRPPRPNWAETFFASYGGTAPDFEETLGGRVRCRVSRQGRIVVINAGRHGRGFRICTWCGRAEPAPLTGRASRGPHADIRRPGRECGGTVRTYQLGHEFLTDLLELDLGIPMSEDEARSVLAALLSSTASVGVVQSDVAGTLATFGGSSRAIVLFDSVPGGAGHARRLRTYLRDLFQAALDRAGNCTCGEETSCYGCLRSYSNQLWHERLSRGAARDVLEAVAV